MSCVGHLVTHTHSKTHVAWFYTTHLQIGLKQARCCAFSTRINGLRSAIALLNQGSVKYNSSAFCWQGKWAKGLVCFYLLIQAKHVKCLFAIQHFAFLFCVQIHNLQSSIAIGIIAAPKEQPPKVMGPWELCLTQLSYHTVWPSVLHFDKRLRSSLALKATRFLLSLLYN